MMIAQKSRKNIFFLCFRLKAELIALAMNLALHGFLLQGESYRPLIIVEKRFHRYEYIYINLVPTLAALARINNRTHARNNGLQYVHRGNNARAREGIRSDSDRGLT